MSRKKRWKGPHHGGWSNTSRGEGPYVSVFCRGEDDNPHEKWRVASLYPELLDDALFWVESTSGYADHSRRELFVTHPPVTQYLSGDRWLATTEQKTARHQAGFRMRWAFRCSQCGFSQVFARPLQLADAVTEIAALHAEDGIVEISLRAFASHLRQHASRRTGQTDA